MTTLNGKGKKRQYALPDWMRGPATPAPSPKQVAFPKSPPGLRDLAGWKLHLAVKPEHRDAVDKFLKSQNLSFKAGRNDDQEGKDFTVYVGHKDRANEVGSAIHNNVGHLLSAPSGDSLKTNQKFVGNVTGRFDPTGDDYFHQYGSAGIPYSNDAVNNSLFGGVLDKPGEIAKSHKILSQKYGDFYTGTQPQPESPIPEKKGMSAKKGMASARNELGKIIYNLLAAQKSVAKKRYAAPGPSPAPVSRQFSEIPLSDPPPEVPIAPPKAKVPNPKLSSGPQAFTGWHRPFHEAIAANPRDRGTYLKKYAEALRAHGHPHFANLLEVVAAHAISNDGGLANSKRGERNEARVREPAPTNIPGVLGHEELHPNQMPYLTTFPVNGKPGLHHVGIGFPLSSGAIAHMNLSSGETGNPLGSQLHEAAMAVEAKEPHLGSVNQERISARPSRQQLQHNSKSTLREIRPGSDRLRYAAVLPKKKPGSGHPTIDALLEGLKTATPNGKEYLLSALHNFGITDPAKPISHPGNDIDFSDPDFEPDIFHRKIARSLATEWLRAIKDKASVEDVAPLAKAVKTHGIKPIGKRGETVGFDGGIHEGPAGHFTGDSTVIKRPGLKLVEKQPKGDDADHILVKANVEKPGTAPSQEKQALQRNKIRYAQFDDWKKLRISQGKPAGVSDWMRESTAPELGKGGYSTIKAPELPTDFHRLSTIDLLYPGPKDKPPEPHGESLKIQMAADKRSVLESIPADHRQGILSRIIEAFKSPNSPEAQQYFQSVVSQLRAARIDPIQAVSEMLHGVKPRPSHESSLGDFLRSKAKIFKTSQGSLYSHENGSTTRVKTPHFGHEQTDVGVKPTSLVTHYVDPDSAKRLGMWQTSSASGKRAILNNGHILLVSKHPATGVLQRDEKLPIISSEPKVGLSPIELDTPSLSIPGAYKGNHPGNPITSIEEPTKEHYDLLHQNSSESPKIQMAADKSKTLEVPQKTQEPSCEIIPLKDIRQEFSFDCGAAITLSVCSYFDVGTKDLKVLANKLGTSEKNSTDPMRIVKYLSESGLIAIPRWNMELADLKTAWLAGSPVIVRASDYMESKVKSKDSYGHYLCFCGMAGSNYLVFQDSSEDNVIAKGSNSIQAPGKILIEKEVFLKNWHDTDTEGGKFVRFGIVVSKPGEAK